MTWEIVSFSVSAAETKRCQRDDDPLPAYQSELCREGKDSSLHLFAPAVMRFPYLCWLVEGLTLPASFLADHKDAENYLKGSVQQQKELQRCIRKCFYRLVHVEKVSLSEGFGPDRSVNGSSCF